MTGRIGAVVAAIVLAGGLATPALAQSSGDSWAQQNVKQSQQYQQLVCSNSAFRRSRIIKECGSLQGSDLYQSCVASFNCSTNPAVNPRAVPPSERIQ